MAQRPSRMPPPPTAYSNRPARQGPPPPRDLDTEGFHPVDPSPRRRNRTEEQEPVVASPRRARAKDLTEERIWRNLDKKNVQYERRSIYDGVGEKTENRLKGFAHHYNRPVAKWAKRLLIGGGIVCIFVAPPVALAIGGWKAADLVGRGGIGLFNAKEARNERRQAKQAETAMRRYKQADPRGFERYQQDRGLDQVRENHQASLDAIYGADYGRENGVLTNDEARARFQGPTSDNVVIAALQDRAHQAEMKAMEYKHALERASWQSAMDALRQEGRVVGRDVQDLTQSVLPHTRTTQPEIDYSTGRPSVAPSPADQPPLRLTEQPEVDYSAGPTVDASELTSRIDIDEPTTPVSPQPSVDSTTPRPPLDVNEDTTRPISRRRQPSVDQNMPVDDKTTAYAHPAESTRVVSSDRTGTGVEQTTIVDEAAEEALKTRGAAVNLLAVAGTYDKALGATMRAAVRDDPTLLADHIAIFNHLTSDPVTKMQVMEALAKGKAELTGTQASFFEESLDRVSSDSAYPNVKANFSSDVNALFQSAHADPTSLFDPSMARTPETKTPVERFGPSM